ncbi:MAG: hypothetical protein LH618_05790, partial [Saprospiraceae bacterium]|nr:hypothetical protein [Saprospiraceae bacterium]
HICRAYGESRAVQDLAAEAGELRGGLIGDWCISDREEQAVIFSWQLAVRHFSYPFLYDKK